MDLHYEIEFFSCWHCGSGLAAGADVDLLVIKDADGLPFVPGKTIKGLVREAAEDILTFSDKTDFSIIAELFGNSADRNNLPESDSALRQGCLFFGDAVIRGGRAQIIEEGLAEYMYASVSSTAIGEDGTALAHSLRKMEVAVPCVLEGEILNVPDDSISLLEQSLKFIKRLGQNRNRGLGRCDMRRKEACGI